MITQKLNVWSLLKKSFLATACIACSAELMAENEPEIVNGIKYSITDAKSVEVVGYEETLPSELTLDSVQINDKWYKVTGIGDEAFANNFDIVSFSAPNVTSVGKGAFSECYGLISVSLGEVVAIRDGAFGRCYGMYSIKLHQPDPTMITLGEGVFESGKITLIVPSEEAVTDYKNNDTWKNLGFKNIIAKSQDGLYIAYEVIGESEEVRVTSCILDGVTGVVIPDSVQINDKWYKVTCIGVEAFSYCPTLTSVSAPSVTRIETAAFSQHGLRESRPTLVVDFPNVESIGSYAFEGGGVTSMDFPKVTFLDERALAGCVNLTSVNLPQVKELPFALFDHDWNLRSVSLGEVTSIDQWAFSNCSSLDTLIVRQPDPIKMQFADLNVFNEVNLGNVTLFVPKGSKDAYLAVHQAMSINFKNVIEYDSNIDPNATYVVITEKDGKQTTVKVDADVKVEWMKGSEIKKK